MGFFKKYYDSVDKHRSPMQAGGLTLFDVIRPVYDSVYKDGIEEGKKVGYETASSEYESKLLDQADKFLKHTRIYENIKCEYEGLLDEYEKEIVELNNKVNRTGAENEYLQKLLLRERELRKMKCR